MLWKDRESISFLLSTHQPEQGEPAKRKVKRVNIYQETEFLCPKLVSGDNTVNSGEELATTTRYDPFEKQKRQKKWHTRLVITLIFM